MGIVHIGSSSLHTIIIESTDEGDTTSSEGGEFRLPHLLTKQRGDPICPAFTRASQIMVTAASLLNALLVPSTDGVDRVYRQLKDILSIAFT
jgi:hypothetical protein